jgi:hypothetical protein
MPAGFVILWVVLAGQSAGSGVYIDKGGCPGEGCQYDETWVARQSVDLLREPTVKSPVVVTVRQGDPVRTVTGEVHTVPGRFIVRTAHDEFVPGDEVLVYTYLGEGHFRVRHNGVLKEADLDFGPGGGSNGKRCEVASRCWGTLQTEHQSTWWIKVRTESGLEGWTVQGAKFLHPIELAAQVAIPERRVPSTSRSELAIRAARQVMVQAIDPALPRLSFDEWLRQIIGSDAPVTWESNDCGEQTGNPAVDRGRDFPVCVEARVDLAAGRTLRISFMVGTLEKGGPDRRVSARPASRRDKADGRRTSGRCLRS